MKRPLITAALLSSMIAAPVLAASVTTDSFEMEVEFDRAALDDRGSLAEEYENIREQVSQRCADEHDDLSALRRIFAKKRCTYRTLENTIQSIDHDGLMALHVQQREN